MSQPVEDLVDVVTKHVAWLRAMADAEEAAGSRATPRAQRAAADVLEQHCASVRSWLALDDTAVIVVGRPR